MEKIEIDGVKYFLATGVINQLGISRQTLWRWRKQGKIPVGHRYRERILLFTSTEVDEIRQFADRVQPAKPNNSRQLSLLK
jgi:predicted DNA-binding transcriptional regulator AlpA